jgi:DNA polymerase-3 subunit gamma/tau
MFYEPLHHKYRPQTFADLVGQDAIATTLTNAIQTSKIAPAYLFTGPRGTGKTSSARIMAKSLNCLKSNVPTPAPCGVCDVCHSITKGSALDVIEIDAASNTGVENVRDIIERSQFAPVQCRYKVYVVDECHMLSTAAFNALLKTLEEPPERVIFILATTDPQRVLPTIISRCQRFDFRRIPIDAMVSHLSAIASKENININSEALQLVAQNAQGGLRDAESLLDQLSLLSGQVTIERVWDLVGTCSELDLMQLLRAIAANKPETVLDCARAVMDRGREPINILQNLAGFYRDLLIAKTAPSRSDLVAVTAATWQALCEEADKLDIANILAGQQHLAKSEVQLKNTTQPRLWLEVTLLGLLPAAHQQNINPQLSTLASQAGTQNVKPAFSQPLQHPEGGRNHPSTQTQPTPVNDAVAHNSAPTQATPDNPTLQPISDHKPLEPSEDASIPAQPAIEPLPSGVDSASQTSRKQIWQQVLANLQPISTRELLRQMCELIEFDGNFARIGVKSQAWYKKTQTHLPNITSAFGATFKGEVQVSLELATPTQTKTTSVNQVQAPGTATPATSAQNTQPQPGYFSPSSSTQTQAIKEVQPEITTHKSTAANVLDPPTDGGGDLHTYNLTEWQDDEVLIAAQRLADFFNGQLVERNFDSALPLSATTNSPLPALTTPAPELSNFEPEDEDIEF